MSDTQLTVKSDVMADAAQYGADVEKTRGIARNIWQQTVRDDNAAIRALVARIMQRMAEVDTTGRGANGALRQTEAYSQAVTCIAALDAMDATDTANPLYGQYVDTRNAALAHLARHVPTNLQTQNEFTKWVSDTSARDEMRGIRDILRQAGSEKIRYVAPQMQDARAAIVAARKAKDDARIAAQAEREAKAIAASQAANTTAMLPAPEATTADTSKPAKSK